MHMITFDYRSMHARPLKSSISFWLQHNWADKLKFIYWSLLLSHESWSKSCKRRSSELVAFITTLMGCRETIFIHESTIDFPIFLHFLIQSFLFFLFSYFSEHHGTAHPANIQFLLFIFFMLYHLKPSANF